MNRLFSKSFNPLTDLPDLKGKVIIVTGAKYVFCLVIKFLPKSTKNHSTGIGLGTVKHLARRGATVYLGARSESKATDAIKQLEAEGLGPGFGPVKWLNVELSDPRNAKAAAEDFLSKETRLDVLGEYVGRRRVLGTNEMFTKVNNAAM
jgi:NAD(P)-dependent dehydrogenase (short-subunit alcohol dehydrogenase family)